MSGLRVGVTGPTGEIGRSLLRALDHHEAVERIVGMARSPFDPAAERLKRSSTGRATFSSEAVRHGRGGASTGIAERQGEVLGVPRLSSSGSGIEVEGLVE